MASLSQLSKMLLAMTPLLTLSGTEAYATGIAQRSVPGPLVWAANQTLAGCICPADSYGEWGILINIFPGYQCAYPNGACAWSDVSGRLQNTPQGNCEAYAPCASTGCTCPDDLNGDAGVLINYFRGYQCAYLRGICTWDQFGNVVTLAGANPSNCLATDTCSALN